MSWFRTVPYRPGHKKYQQDHSEVMDCLALEIEKNRRALEEHRKEQRKSKHGQLHR